MENTQSQIADSRREWTRVGCRRRIVLLLLIIAPSLAAAAVMRSLLPAQNGAFMNGLTVLLFGMLFAWVAVGFWSALAGLIISIRRYDRFSIVRGLPNDHSLPPEARTALLFPIYNEDPIKVTEEIRTVWRSLKEINAEGCFDVFILSDSTNPDSWASEQEAWFRLCHEEQAEGRIFYRHRKINRKGKSGNVADFCRRWGAHYRYMTVFDADSLMSGHTLVKLTQAMEAHPDVGIIQTAPKSINSRSLIARMQQFSNHLYGPVFAAGLHYWQLGDAQYWGHNAILRIEPFMRFCHLPTLSGPAPLGGHILSHDFVEAALMRRGGYSVWLAYELDGSHEENPPSLIDELIRDRRWCQGNLQHSRLVFTRGFFPTHRALFVNGIMSYGSAMLWFLFLLVSSVQAALELLTTPNYFPEGYTLFPDWPKYFSHRSLGLLAATAVLLFLPKLFTLFFVTFKGGARGFGGVTAMSLSVLIEVAASALLAPVRMLFHSLFVITTLLGFTVRWNNQNRDDRGTTWWQAIRFHWWGVLLGLFWGAAMYVANPGFFLWLSPVVIGLLVSIPLSVATSMPSLGEAAMRLRLFLTPADTNPPPEVRAFQENLAQRHHSSFLTGPDDGFIRTVTIPSLLALHLTLLRRQDAKRTREQTEELTGCCDKALRNGPHALSSAERKRLLNDPESLVYLHTRIWILDAHKAREWGIR